MGGVIKPYAAKVSSSLNFIDDFNKPAAYYKTLVREADKQAQTITQKAAEQESSLFESAALRSRSLYQNYRQNLAAQKAVWAASGVTDQSATVQQQLQNSRLGELLQENQTARDFAGSVAQNRQQTAAQIRALEEELQFQRKKTKQSASKWKLGSNLLSLWLEN